MINILVKLRIPLSIAFFGCQFIWFRSDANFLDLQSLTFLAIMSFIFLVGLWLFLLFDMINSKMYNKTFWLISMLIMPNFAPAIYLFQRRNLQRSRSSLFRRE